VATRNIYPGEFVTLTYNASLEDPNVIINKIKLTINKNKNVKLNQKKRKQTTTKKRRYKVTHA
jgi:hypothetical protein